MFKEYQTWRSKLELIEQRMKSEADHWKSAAERLQKENMLLQKEALKMQQQMMEKAKLLKSKEDTISKLQQLDTVEEAICQNCKNSLEESFHIARKDFAEPKKQQVNEEI